MEAVTTSSSGTVPTKRTDLTSELCCPICLDTIKEAFVTKCGHSYCFQCISKYLTQKPKCPTCMQPLSRDQIFPNYMLHGILESAKALEQTHMESPRKQLNALLSDSNQLGVADIDKLLAVLAQKKKKIQMEEQHLDAEITDALLDFLQQTKQSRFEILQQVQQEISMLSEDISYLEKIKSSGEKEVNSRKRYNEDEVPVSRDDFVQDEVPKEEDQVPTVDLKKRRITEHFKDLQAEYLNIRKSEQSLDFFKDSLAKFARYSHFETISTVRFGNNIVCSIEFDSAGEVFAAAGVTQKIRIYDYSSVVSNPTEHFPVQEMSWAAKISCIKWNTYLKSKLLSSDYDGTVCLWDTVYGRDISKYEEHTKRVWSIDFNKVDPTRFASASDDAKLKIWATTHPRSVATIEGKANICCVQFNPKSSYELMAGSADHLTVLYDMRKLSEPVKIYKGHSKAVSYISWLNKDEFLTASTDGTLKLWNLRSPDPVRTYAGHSNEKNFVGLSVNGDYFACGSEDNSVYSYFKPLSKPVMHQQFDTIKPEGRQFISALSWRKDSNVLVAGNSDGLIKVLGLAQ